MMWGKRKENGIWFTRNHRNRFILWRNHDSLYVAFGRFRMRLMKPWFRFDPARAAEKGGGEKAQGSLDSLQNYLEQHGETFRDNPLVVGRAIQVMKRLREDGEMLDWVDTNGFPEWESSITFREAIRKAIPAARAAEKGG